MKNSKVVENAAWIIACRIVQTVLSFLIGTISARYLGPSGYGIIDYASSVTCFLIPVVQLGLRATLVHEIIKNPEKEGRTLGTSLGMSTAASFLGVIGVIAFCSIANKNDPTTIAVCALYSISLVFQSFEVIQYWFQAKLLSKYVSVISLLAYGTVSAYRIFLLVSGKSVYWFALSQTIDYFVIAGLLFVVYKKLNGPKLSFSFAAAKELFSRSRYYIISGIMVTLFSVTDRIMLNLMVGEEAGGFYAAAFTCAGASQFVFAAIVDSARPSILSAKNISAEIYEKNIKRLYSIIIYLGLAQSLVFTFGAGLAINILYGAQYAPAISVLRVLTWYSGFAYMGSVRNIWILAEEKQSILWKINLCGAVLNIGANLLLIPHWGAMGAATSSVLAQLFTNFVLCFIVKPIRPTGRLLLESINPFKLKELLFGKN